LFRGKGRENEKKRVFLWRGKNLNCFFYKAIFALALFIERFFLQISFKTGGEKKSSTSLSGGGFGGGGGVLGWPPPKNLSLRDYPRKRERERVTSSHRRVRMANAIDVLACPWARMAGRIHQNWAYSPPCEVLLYYNFTRIREEERLTERK